ncbi:MAG: hypothetical protein K5769_01440 [Pseudobutyrivibrio sp.]|nr:hypothetical protein [Pseudobutyrivibrio sp.]
MPKETGNRNRRRNTEAWNNMTVAELRQELEKGYRDINNRYGNRTNMANMTYEELGRELENRIRDFKKRDLGSMTNMTDEERSKEFEKKVRKSNQKRVESVSKDLSSIIEKYKLEDSLKNKRLTKKRKREIISGLDNAIDEKNEVIKDNIMNAEYVSEATAEFDTVINKVIDYYRAKMPELERYRNTTSSTSEQRAAKRQKTDNSSVNVEIVPPAWTLDSSMFSKDNSPSNNSSTSKAKRKYSDFNIVTITSEDDQEFANRQKTDNQKSYKPGADKYKAPINDMANPSNNGNLSISPKQQGLG